MLKASIESSDKLVTKEQIDETWRASMLEYIRAYARKHTTVTDRESYLDETEVWNAVSASVNEITLWEVPMAHALAFLHEVFLRKVAKVENQPAPVVNSKYQQFLRDTGKAIHDFYKVHPNALLTTLPSGDAYAMLIPEGPHWLICAANTNVWTLDENIRFLNRQLGLQLPPKNKSVASEPTPTATAKIVENDRAANIEAAAKVLAERLATPEGKASMAAAAKESQKRANERQAAGYFDYRRCRCRRNCQCHSGMRPLEPSLTKPMISPNVEPVKSIEDALIDVRESIDKRGFAETFMNWSRFTEVQDEKFHTLRQEFISAYAHLDSYIKASEKS
jgi:hypothetical protein